MTQYSISKSLLIKSQETALKAKGQGLRHSYRVGAVLFNGKKRVVNAKTNTAKTHPALLPFTKYPFLHAESNCIISHGIDNCRGLCLVVSRVLRNGTIAMARPCLVCEALIKYVGISEVWYSNWEGRYECLKI